MRSTDEVLGWRSRKAVDRDGDKLGTIEEIYLDADSGNPQWAAVKTGLLGSKLTFVPLEGARPQDDDVVLDWPKDVVKEAPSIDADGQLSPEEEDRLYDHYERYDSPEYHGGGGTADARSSSRDDDDNDHVPAAAEGAAVASGVGRGDDDGTGARAQGGPDAGPGGMSSTRSTGGETISSEDRSAGGGTISSDDRSSSGETISSDDRSSSGGTYSSDEQASSGGVTSSGDTSSSARTVSSEGSSSSGTDTSSAPDASASGARRPRIKRFIEEELGPDGNPVRRSTRTEETFD